MKRIYACLCIVAVLLGVAFYSSWRVQKFAEDISDDIDNAMEAIRDEDLLPRGRHWPRALNSATKCGKG